MKKIRNNKKRGYTIIETMITVSLFIIVVMAGMGALLNANLLHQKSRDMRSIMDNLSFIMEEMSRNLRTGYHYRCYDSVLPWNQSYAQNNGGANNNTANDLNTPRSCTTGWVLVFEEAHGSTLSTTPADPNAHDQWIYFIGTYNGKTGIFKSVTGGGTSANPEWVQLTPDEIVIDTTLSSFSVFGAEPPATGDNQQPFVTIRLVGNINFKGASTPFSLQTSMSQRGIDI